MAKKQDVEKVEAPEAPETVRLKGGNCSANGNEYTADKGGFIFVAPADVASLLELGCERA